MLQIVGWFGRKRNSLKPSGVMPKLTHQTRHTCEVFYIKISRFAVFFIRKGIAYAIAVKTLCAGKLSWKKPLHREKVQYMPSTYPSRLSTQGGGLGSQRSLHSIWVIEVGSSHIGR